jgi:hypothetical protein
LGRNLNELIAATQSSSKAKVAEETADGVVEVVSFKPDNISQEVWDLIQENGELATRRLNEILVGPRFHRLRAGDQAKLIALAQNRAYGMPLTNNVDKSKTRTGTGDVTQAELNKLAGRAALPEYKKINQHVEDAEIVPPRERAKK